MESHFHLIVDYNNKLTHRDVRLYCMHKGCKKYFKAVGDLNWHVRQHDNALYYHCDYCMYKNLNKRNTKSHMRIHVTGNERYSCHLCGKPFKFSTQHRRHLKEGCNLDDVNAAQRSDSPDF